MGPNTFQWCPVTGQGAMGTNWSRGSSSWTWGWASSLWGWQSAGTGCPGKLWSLLLWRYSTPAWTRFCAACSGWPCFGRRVGLDDPQRSLPTPNILWFCASTNLREIIAEAEGVGEETPRRRWLRPSIQGLSFLWRWLCHIPVQHRTLLKSWSTPGTAVWNNPAESLQLRDEQPLCLLVTRRRSLQAASTADGHIWQRTQLAEGAMSQASSWGVASSRVELLSSASSTGSFLASPYQSRVVTC